MNSTSAESGYANGCYGRPTLAALIHEGKGWDYISRSSTRYAVSASTVITGLMPAEPIREKGVLRIESVMHTYYVRSIL
jgi:hypothetical protein